MIVVILKCPKCGCEQEFSEYDFEWDVECPKCGYTDEAWFFWHRPRDIPPRKGFITPVEVWSIGAHYPNDALCLSNEDFMEYFYGGGKIWHGGEPYIWVEVYKRDDGSVYTRANILTTIYDINSEAYKLKKIEELLRNFDEFIRQKH